MGSTSKSRGDSSSKNHTKRKEKSRKDPVPARRVQPDARGETGSNRHSEEPNQERGRPVPRPVVASSRGREESERERSVEDRARLASSVRDDHGVEDDEATDETAHRRKMLAKQLYDSEAREK